MLSQEEENIYNEMSNLHRKLNTTRMGIEDCDINTVPSLNRFHISKYVSNFISKSTTKNEEVEKLSIPPSSTRKSTSVSATSVMNISNTVDAKKKRYLDQYENYTKLNEMINKETEKALVKDKNDILNSYKKSKTVRKHVKETEVGINKSREEVMMLIRKKDELNERIKEVILDPIYDKDDMNLQGELFSLHTQTIELGLKSTIVEKLSHKICVIIEDQIESLISQSVPSIDLLNSICKEIESRGLEIKPESIKKLEKLKSRITAN